MVCDDLDTINSYFAVAKNQFTKPIYNWIWITNPWVGMFPRSMFNPQDGLIPEVNTTTARMVAIPTTAPRSTVLTDRSGQSPYGELTDRSSR